MWKQYAFGFLIGAALILDGLAWAQAPPEVTPQKATTDVDLKRPCVFTFQMQGGKTELHGMCPNHYSGTWQVQAVACDVSGGEVTVLPRLAKGAANSVLGTPLTCGVNQSTGVVVSGTPRLNPRAANAAACPKPPCDLEITISAPADEVMRSGIVTIDGTLTVGTKP